jgi:hypothetical protein
VRGSPDPALVSTAGLRLLGCRWRVRETVPVERIGSVGDRPQRDLRLTGHNDIDAGGLLILLYHVASHAEVSAGEV